MLTLKLMGDDLPIPFEFIPMNNATDAHINSNRTEILINFVFLNVCMKNIHVHMSTPDILLKSGP